MVRDVISKLSWPTAASLVMKRGHLGIMVFIYVVIRICKHVVHPGSECRQARTLLRFTIQVMGLEETRTFYKMVVAFVQSTIGTTRVRKRYLQLVSEQPKSHRWHTSKMHTKIGLTLHHTLTGKLLEANFKMKSKPEYKKICFKGSQGI